MVIEEIKINVNKENKQIEIHVETTNDDSTTKEEKIISEVIGECIDEFVTDTRFAKIINNYLKEK